MWPVSFDSREELFEIPKGTWARRMAGDTREILPSEIHLIVGMRDVLVLKNSDDVPQMFGPTLLMPGQTFRLPFTRPSENFFACTAHASGQLVIVGLSDEIRYTMEMTGFLDFFLVAASLEEAFAQVQHATIDHAGAR